MTIKKQFKKPVKSTPLWLLSSDNYSPQEDKEKFLRKTILSIIAKLKFFQSNSSTDFSSKISGAFILFFIFLVIILLVSSKKLAFPLLIFAITFVYLSFFNAKTIIIILKKSTLAAFFSLIILLPAILSGNTYFFYLPFKIFTTVMILSIFSQHIPFYKISHAMSSFHIPATFILILDLTIKYIILLGNTATNLLTALKLRSVGKNNHKYESLAGILGITFIKSQNYTVETYNSMKCRCFTGDYTIKNSYHLKKFDFIYIILILIVLIIFLYLEGYLL